MRVESFCLFIYSLIYKITLFINSFIYNTIINDKVTKYLNIHKKTKICAMQNRAFNRFLKIK